MSAPGLLHTKLFPPRQRAEWVVRARLLDQLNRGLDRKLILVAAPAGSGKTTLISMWQAATAAPVAWLSLDEGDNDFATCLSYLLAALEGATGLDFQAIRDLLAESPQPNTTEIATLLINALAAQPRLIWVVDDYHVLHNPAIHALMQDLIDYKPPHVTMILLTRIDPPFPLARWRASGELVEIRAHDLRFTQAEAADFLSQTMGLAVSAEDVAALEARTEGWAVGLQLAALSMQGRSDIPAFVQAFTGSHLYVAEYLLEEVLQRQPETVRAFLLDTAILPRLTAGLCAAVTGCTDAQAMLTDLHRANLFLVPLDQEGCWFRYHHLFADLLRARLQQQQPAEVVAALHTRAADWYERHGLIPEAVQQALAARDFARAAALVDEAGQAMIFTEHQLLKTWLDALPAEMVQLYPRLELYRVLIHLSLGTLDMAEATLEATERLITTLPPTPDNDRLRREALAYLSLFLAHQNTTRALQLAQATLAEIPESDLRLRSVVYSTLYRAYGMAGDYAQAAPAYRECLRLSQAARQYRMVAVTTMVRAFDLCQYGRLEEAAHYCRVILEAGETLTATVFYAAGPAWIGLGGVCLEQNDLQAADESLARGIDLCRRSGIDGLYTGYIQQARLLQARADYDGALEVLHRLEQALQRWDFTLIARQVSVRLAMGDVDSAARLVEPLPDILNNRAYARELPLIAVEAFQVVVARVRVAQRDLAQAESLLDALQPIVEAGQRFGRLLEIILLRAQIAQQRQADGISAEAVRFMEQAVALAESSGFVRLVLEDGPALIPLLQAVVERRATPDSIRQYARQLLNAFAAGGQPERSPLPGDAPGLIEALTPREMEVLQLIARGDSNQAIADQLVITVRTVKKHTTNILGKLDAHNRTQAVARARELGLIALD